MRKTILLLVAACFLPAGAWAHCDRVDGPVAAAAREALQARQPAKILAWVGAEQDKELRAAYDLALQAREQGGAAADLAERYLVDTAIRLHREAEGLPFDGVKPATSPMPQDITVAEEALAKGQVDGVVALLNEDLSHQVRQLFEAVKSQQAERDRSLEGGRRWVDAYVRYVAFVHGMHAAIEAGPEHGVGHED